MQRGKGWIEAETRFVGRVLHVGGLHKLPRVTSAEYIGWKA